MTRGAIVLCGGRSTRMGRDKATLPLGRETLLQRVLRLLDAIVEDVVVVSRRDQPLPELTPRARVVHDPVEDLGPLGGLLPGLAATRADAAYVTGCDVPFLVPAFVRLLFDRLGDADVAVPEAGGRLHPLAAVYRPRVRAHVERLVTEGRLRPVFLYEQVPTVRIAEAELMAVDPALRSLDNLNTPEAYAAALGDPQPLVTVELYETARRLAGRAEVVVEARTLGEALTRLAGLLPALAGSVVAEGRPARHWRASVGGRGFVEDPATPLEDGDHVLLVSALAGG